MKKRCLNVLPVFCLACVLFLLSPIVTYATGEVQSIILPVAGEGGETPVVQEVENSFSLFSVEDNQPECIYTYVGVDRLYIYDVTIDTVEEPAANGVLQIVDGEGNVWASNYDFYYWQNSVEEWYVPFVDFKGVGVLPVGEYDLCLVAGGKIYPCLSCIKVVGNDHLLFTSAYTSAMYVGKELFDLHVVFYGLESEGELQKLSFQLLNSNNEVVAESTGAYGGPKLSAHDNSYGRFEVLMQMQVQEGKNIEENEKYNLQISYIGEKALVVDENAIVQQPNTPFPSIEDFLVLDPQTGAVQVVLANYSEEKEYRVLVGINYDETMIYGSYEGVIPGDGVIPIDLKLNGLKMPITGYGSNFNVWVYEREETISSVQKWFDVSYSYMAGIYFEPYLIKPITQEIPFTIYHRDCLYYLDSGNVLSMRNHEGLEVGRCDSFTTTWQKDLQALQGELLIANGISVGTYYLYLNNVQFAQVVATNNLRASFNMLMRDYDTGTFWSNLGQLPISVNAINSSGTASFVIKQDDQDVLSSAPIEGAESEHHDHLLYEIQTMGDLDKLQDGQAYTLVLRDDYNEQVLLNEEKFIYIGEKVPLDFTNSSHASFRRNNPKAGDDTILVNIHLMNSFGPRNITETDLEEAIQALSFSTGNEIITVDKYQNGIWLSNKHIYQLELVLSSTLTAGKYTIFSNGEKFDTFNVRRSELEEIPNLYLSNARGGCITGCNFPSKNTYTGKLYQGYDCLTVNAFHLELVGENDGDTQYLYFDKNLLTELDVGVYELWVYMDERILGTVDVTIEDEIMPLVYVYTLGKPLNYSGDPVIQRTSVQINAINMGAYQYLRWAETPDDLPEKSYNPYFSTGYYTYDFDEGDGSRSLFVELSKTGSGNDDNLIYEIGLWLCTTGDYDVQVPETIQGVQHSADEKYAITATVALPATKLWVSFFDMEGKQVTQQMAYDGLITEGRYQFSFSFDIADEVWSGYDNDDFYYRDTQYIQVFATNLRDQYNPEGTYYGDKVGKAIKRCLIFGDPQNIILPQFVRGEALTKETSYAIFGYATPNKMVTLSINEGTTESIQANEYGYFEIMLPVLTEGEYILTIEDEEGITTAFNPLLIVDTTPPVIKDIGFDFLDSNNAVIHWVCADEDVDFFQVYKDNILLGRAAANTFSYNIVARVDDGVDFTIKAIDKAGNIGEKTVSTADTEPPTAPPFAPEVISRTTTTITLSWEAGSDNMGISGYNLYQGNTLLAETLGENELTYMLTGLKAGTEYSLVVRTRDWAGNLSELSDNIIVSTVGLLVEQFTLEDVYCVDEYAVTKNIPLEFIVTADDFNYEVALTNARLEFKLAEEPEEIGWLSQDFFISDNGVSGIWGIAGSAEDGYLPMGNYKVRLVITDDEGAEVTNEAKLVVLKRDTEIPVITSFTLQDGFDEVYGGKDLKLFVEAIDNVEVAHIDLFYKSKEGGEFEEITTLTNMQGGDSFSDSYNWNASFLESGEYVLKAVAYDLRGNISEPFSKEITLDNEPPLTPGEFSVTGTSRYIYVLWDSSYQAPDDFETFNVYRATAIDGFYERVGGVAEKVGYYDDGQTIEAGITYYYYVTAQDKYGNESEPTEKLSAVLADDNESPQISDLLPRDGVELCKTVRLRAWATDNYRLSKAVFEYRYHDADEWLKIGEEEVTSLTNNFIFSYAWDISALSSGTYEIRVKVYDDSINDVGIEDYKANDPAVLMRTVTIKQYVEPVAPVLTVENGYKTTELSWEYNGAVNLLQQFEIYRAEVGNADFVYVTTVKPGVTGKYQTTVSATEEFEFKVVAVDKYGVFTSSNTVVAKSEGHDNEPPVAIIMPEGLTGAVGVPFQFSGINSTDNDVIVAYDWDFGDDFTGSGAKCTHTYLREGTYSVKLTVKDECHNQHTMQAPIVIYDLTTEDVAHVLWQMTVVDGSEESTPPIEGAEIKLYNEVDPNNEQYVTAAFTDANGQVSLVVPQDTYTVSVVAEGYVAASRVFNVEPDENGFFAGTIGLTPMNVSLVDGSLTCEEMDYDDILAAGIDLNDPNNEQVWKFEAHLQFDSSLFLLDWPLIAYFNCAGKLIDGIDCNWGWLPHCTGMNIGVFPISRDFILVIYGESHWLKEMYNVELLVINNSYLDNITDCVATLELPPGLSLATLTNEIQTAAIDLGTIALADSNENTAKAIWYVRGDQEGEYNLAANVTGLNPEPFLKTFTTDNPVKIYAGNALHLTITAEDFAFFDKEYRVQFKLENVSEKNLHNLSFGITGAKQFSVSGNDFNILTQENFGDGQTCALKTLAPGDAVTVDFATTSWFFSAGELLELGPLDIGYYLKSVFVPTLGNSTTVIPHTIKVTHTPHGSFSEWLWDKAKDGVIDNCVDLVAKKMFVVKYMAKNGKKIYRFSTKDIDTSAASKIEITVENGSFVREYTSPGIKTFNREAISIYTDANESDYIISPDGKTLSLTGTANIYVQGEAPGEAMMNVTTYTWDQTTEKYLPNIYNVNYFVDETEGVAERVVLQAPENDRITVPVSGNKERIIFPYVFLDAEGNCLCDASGAEWTFSGPGTTGLVLEKGVLTVFSTAQAGDYTVRLALNDLEYAEQTISLIKEESGVAELKFYREGQEIFALDTLLISQDEEPQTYSYEVKAFDQYGLEMSAPLNWEVSENINEFQIEDGVVRLTADSTSGSFVLSVTSGVKSTAITVFVTNLLVDWTAVETIINETVYVYGDANNKAILPINGIAMGNIHGAFVYENGMDVQSAGQRKLIIKFIVDEDGGEYANISVPREFIINIAQKPLAEEMITVSGNYVYNGSHIIPTYTVADGSLLTSADYQVQITDNIKAGNAWLTITAVENGNYSGRVNKSFRIEPISLVELMPVLTGNGEVGQNLTAALVLDNFEKTDFSWQWLRDGIVVVEGECVYPLTAEDSGSLITVIATAKSGTNYAGATQVSAGIIVGQLVLDGEIMIIQDKVGEIELGDLLIVDITALTPEEIQLGGSYQWYRNGELIDNAEQAFYVITPADSEAELEVVYLPSGKFSGTARAVYEVGKISFTSAENIMGNNILIVGKYAFDLNNAEAKFNLNNYLTAIQTAYFDSANQAYQIYYQAGNQWYDLVKADKMGQGLVDETEIKAKVINEEGIVTYWNMERVNT